MKSLLFTLTLILISGCASSEKPLVFSGNSPSILKTEINRQIELLPEGKKEQFLIALLSIQMAATNNPLAFLSGKDGEALNYELLAKEIDGLTYKQVLERASESKISVEILSD